MWVSKLWVDHKNNFSIDTILGQLVVVVEEDTAVFFSVDWKLYSNSCLSYSW